MAEGTDSWLVYNEGLDTTCDRDILQMDRFSPLSMSRALTVKYTYTFNF